MYDEDKDDLGTDNTSDMAWMHSENLKCARRVVKTLGPMDMDGKKMSPTEVGAYNAALRLLERVFDSVWKED